MYKKLTLLVEPMRKASFVYSSNTVLKIDSYTVVALSCNHWINENSFCCPAALLSYRIFVPFCNFFKNKIFKETFLFNTEYCLSVYADTKVNQEEKPGFILFAVIL